VPPKAANVQALQAVLKALELDDTLAEAHAVMGALRACDFDWKNAEREFDRAVELDPTSADVWGTYNFYYLVPMGRLDEAITAARRAVQLDPLSSFLRFRFGSWYYRARQWERAIGQFRHALELDPHIWFALMELGLAYLSVRKFDEAAQPLETAVQMTGRWPLALSLQGALYALTGRIGHARSLLAELEELARRTYVPPTFAGWIYVSLGEIEKAFDSFEAAVDSSDGFVLDVQVHPLCDPLRSHPRYAALLRKMNLAP
jgi:tetratricopeptide (TPR) repeat protein